MRRFVLPLAGLAALSCASARPAAQPAPVDAAPAALPGFERQAGETVREHDLTHDGKPDVWKFTVKDATGRDVLVREEKDLNGDGKVDVWERYAPDGALTRVAYDLDFDGRPDVVLFYEKDQLVRKEMAFGFDGVPHAWLYYEKGKLVRKERDTNGDGKVDAWEYWENGEIDRIGLDLDGDGQVDRWEARRSAEATSAAPAQPVRPAAEPRDQK
jgi:hypothetical protein